LALSRDLRNPLDSTVKPRFQQHRKAERAKMVKTIVVLGASYAGLAVAHRLLKHTYQREKDIKVVLVSKVRDGARNSPQPRSGWSAHGTEDQANLGPGPMVDIICHTISS
jgi:pyrimidine operon attenuation protein/uracil phosphoribosyltransferase